MTPPLGPAGGVSSLGSGVGAPPALPNAVGTNRAAASLPMTLQLPLPENVPIPGATVFNRLATADTTAAESGKPMAGPDTGGALLVLPPASIARIETVVLYVQNLQTVSNLTLSLLEGVTPIPGFSDLAIFPGSVALFSLAINGKYITGPGAVLNAQYSNGDGATYKLGLAVSGYFYSMAAAQQWTQAGLR